MTTSAFCATFLKVFVLFLFSFSNIPINIKYRSTRQIRWKFLQEIIHHVQIKRANNSHKIYLFIIAVNCLNLKSETHDLFIIFEIESFNFHPPEVLCYSWRDERPWLTPHPRQLHVECLVERVGNPLVTPGRGSPVEPVWRTGGHLNSLAPGNLNSLAPGRS